MAQPHVVGNAGHKRFQPRVNGGAIRACGQRRGQFGRIPQQTLPDEGRFRASVADFPATRAYAGFQHPIRHQGCPLFHDQRAQGLGRNLFRSSAQGVFHSFQQCKSAGQRFQRHAFGKNIRPETCAQIGKGFTDRRLMGRRQRFLAQPIRQPSVECVGPGRSGRKMLPRHPGPGSLARAGMADQSADAFGNTQCGNPQNHAPRDASGGRPRSPQLGGCIRFRPGEHPLHTRLLDTRAADLVNL